MTTSDPIEVTVHVEATPGTVFRYFTEPSRYVQWMGAEATLDPVPGGTYRVLIRDEVEALGEFLEVDPPRRIVFTWGWRNHPIVPPGSTRVEVTFEPEGSGTLVRLIHLGVPDDEERDQHRQGWDLYLSRLAVTLSGGVPGRDPNAG